MAQKYQTALNSIVYAADQGYNRDPTPMMDHKAQEIGALLGGAG